MIKGLSLNQKYEMSKRNKHKNDPTTPPEIANMSNIRKSYDSRNARTNSAVDKLRMSKEVLHPQSYLEWSHNYGYSALSSTQQHGCIWEHGLKDQ